MDSIKINLDLRSNARNEEYLGFAKEYMHIFSFNFKIQYISNTKVHPQH